MNVEKLHKEELSTLKPGEEFQISNIDFIVLDQQGEETTVISKNLLSKNEVFDSDTADYSHSALKKWIEQKIQPIIEQEIGAENLVKHDVDLTSVDMQNEFGVCSCKVRPITFDEARKYNDLLVSGDAQDWFWTCTPWSTAGRGWGKAVTLVSAQGNFYSASCRSHNDVRPVCISKSHILVSRGE